MKKFSPLTWTSLIILIVTGIYAAIDKTTVLVYDGKIQNDNFKMSFGVL